MTHSKARSSATSDSKLSTPRPTKNRSAAPRRSCRIRRAAHHVVEPVAARAGRVAARRADVGSRRPVPSLTAPPRPAGRSCPMPTRSSTRAARLPDPRLALEYQAPAFAAADVGQQPIQTTALVGPPAQRRQPPGCGKTSLHQAEIISELVLGSAFASSRRERIPSLVNTWRRCHSTVRGLRKSRAPISGFDSPSRASSAI